MLDYIFNTAKANIKGGNTYPNIKGIEHSNKQKREYFLLQE